MQAKDVGASFLVLGNLNGNLQEEGYTISNQYCVAAFDFASVSSCCHQLVVIPAHARRGTVHCLKT